jgi:hypothetical protein
MFVKREGRGRTRAARSASVLPTSGSGRSSYSAGELMPEPSTSLVKACCFSSEATTCFWSDMVAKGETTDSGQQSKGGSWGIYTRALRLAQQAWTPWVSCRDHLAATGTPWGRLAGTGCVAKLSCLALSECVRAWLISPAQKGDRLSVRHAPQQALLDAVVQRCDCFLTDLSGPVPAPQGEMDISGLTLSRWAQESDCRRGCEIFRPLKLEQKALYTIFYLPHTCFGHG